jgi:ABC-2 type transport system ATP-binding protein
MEEAEQLCDNIIIIDHGKILKEGTLKQLLEDNKGENVISFSLEDNSSATVVLQSDKRFNIKWDEVQGQGTGVLSSMENELPEFLNFLHSNNLRLKNLEFKRKTLDDLFTTLTGRHLHE